MKILIIGAGAWGTALAISAAGRHAVRLWAREAAQAQALAEARRNVRYLPEVPWPDGLEACASPIESHAQWADLVVLATPMAGLREWLARLAGCHRAVIWLCKGFEVARGDEPGRLGHEIHAQVAPGLRAGVLSGPSFALEVARAQPTALVAASEDPALRQVTVDAFHTESLRVYANDDIVGVEVGGAVKNVLAIATGLCDGLQLGLNARAALITRGLAEITRLGAALGARPDTFMGLSGLGDLVLTATGELSRNRRVGLLMAQGHSAEQAVASLGHVAEGVYTARTALARAQQLGVDMPIARAVVSLLDGRSSPKEAVAALMGREPRRE